MSANKQRTELSREIRHELRALAQRFANRDLEHLVEEAPDKEALCEGLLKARVPAHQRALISSYRDTLDDETIIGELRAVKPGKPIMRQVFAVADPHEPQCWPEKG
jgi:hypothetical protein